jgi:hypothetical protein
MKPQKRQLVSPRDLEPVEEEEDGQGFFYPLLMCFTNSLIPFIQESS